MKIRRCANKALAVLLAVSLVCGTNAPVSAFANESVAADENAVVSENAVETQEVSVVAEGDTQARAIERVTPYYGEEGINLNGNPVVIEQAYDAGGNLLVDKFSLILDADRDGIADDGETMLAIEEETAFDSSLVVYGSYGDYEGTGEDVFITMNSGNVAAIYGSYDASVTGVSSAGNSIYICINGGTVGTVYGCKMSYSDNSYYIVGGVTIYVKNDATVTTCDLSDYNGRYNLYGLPLYMNNKGLLALSGEYTLEPGNYESVTVKGGTLAIKSGVSIGVLTISAGEVSLEDDLTVTTLNCDGGNLIIPKQVTLTANSISGWYTYIHLKGTLHAATGTCNAKILTQGGTVTGSATVYDSAYFYPITVTCDYDIEWNVSNESKIASVTENGVTTYYCNYNYSSTLSMRTKMEEMVGYDCYYCIDDGEYALATANDTYYFSFVVPKKAFTLDIQFVPTQIIVDNKYSPVKGTVGQSYTLEEPLCDLSVYEITGDAPAESGGEVKYTLKKGSSLPEGLTLSKGKIIGTPTTEDETGKKVSFVVTGRNGTTADLDVTFKISQEVYDSSDINDLYAAGVIKIENYCLDLGGTSVVIMEGNSSSYSKIYLDEDQDGLPDNKNQLIYNDRDDIYLGSWRVCGYTNTETPYEGDIRITVDGGSVPSLFGVYGNSSTGAKAKVNGDVTISVKSGSVPVQRQNGIRNTTQLKGVYYGVAENVTVDITGGTFESTTLYGAEQASISGNVNFAMGKKARVNMGQDAYKTTICPVADGTVVEGDVNVTLGFENQEAYGFQTNMLGQGYTQYYGVNNAKVDGGVNYTIDGKWYPKLSNTLVKGTSTIASDVNICLGDSAYMSTLVIADGSGLEIGGDIELTAEENSHVAVSTLTVLTNGSTAKNLKIDMPASCTGGNVSVNSYTTGVSGNIYMNNKGEMTLRGAYVLAEDLSLTGLGLLENTSVTIAEGAEVNVTGNKFSVVSGSTLTNIGKLGIYGSGTGLAGMLDNQGELTTSDFTMIASGVAVNRKNGKWTLEGALSNKGKIVNYGSFIQTYKSNNDTYKKLGTIFTTTNLTVSGTISEYTYISGSTPYSALYYLIKAEPLHCVSDVTIAETTPSDPARITTSGISGDNNTYIRMDQYTYTNFSVQLGEQVIENATLTDVTYGPENVAATLEDGVWKGQIGRTVFEPITIRLNYTTDQGATQISLAVVQDFVTDEDKLVVDKTYTYDNPLYNLADIAITGDLNTEGQVLYTVDSGSTLPEGFLFEDGRLYGTFKNATEEEHVIDFVVTGKNQTKAGFTLTLGPVAKAVPQWEIPTGFELEMNETIAALDVPEDTRGTYAWMADSLGSTESAGTVSAKLTFTPSDTENYDWAAAAESTGASYADGVITCTVSVEVKQADPSYEAPTTVTAVYGQTFGEVSIPAGNNEGTFAWDPEHHSGTDKVGDVGEYSCYVVYTPENPNYKAKTGVEVTLNVQPATPDYNETLTETSVICDGTLGDIVLPDVDGGKYQWVSAANIQPADGAMYQVVYIPEDTTNYDWTQITGWSKVRKGVVFSVRVNLEHTAGSEYDYDATHHWYVCASEGCEGACEKTVHTWNAGVITTAPTTTSTGVKTYTCPCGATKTETIAKLPDSGQSGGQSSGGQSSGGQSNAGGEGPSSSVPSLGTTLKDTASKATYKVTKVAKEVTFVKPNKKTYTKVTIPATIKYEGVTYKVTAIADNACKDNKKLKTVKIGSNVKTIGKKAFYGCKKLTSVTIGSKVTTIGESAFQNCTVLKKITIPSKVSKIGKKAFYGCKKLTSMTIKTSKLTDKKVGKDAFKKMGSSNYKKVNVKVPKKKLSAYKKLLKKKGLSSKAIVKK